MAVYVYDIRNVDQAKEDITNSLIFLLLPPPPFLSSAATCSHDQFHLEEVLLEQMLL